ncbi:phage tail fiber repeat family protein [Escherichia coli UMNF18]|uniref:phage tail-collar fiber domain-containing protein n=1 Tax=Escherichia coli TaxID=562 RepID=UPI000217D4CF|nr:phage tail protein [Escherichia coli]AEJ59650.1 phage tail fiber repeat family protein [Escherichia coli UMNF18]
MTVKYYAILTNQGAARLANATMLGSKLNLTQMAVGDANGVLPTPDPAQTKLINQKRIAPLNLLSVDPNNQSQIIAEQIIPENEGGFWIREIGLYDDEGVLIAVANCPETYKPQLQEGSGRTQTIRMILVVTNTEAITLKIDPSVVLATRKYVDDKISEHEQSRRHPDASLTAKGFVQLSSATNSTSEALAATPKAVKAAYDLANGKYTAQDATTARKGLVQLSSATNSTSETQAATPKAVKAAYDLANAKYTAQDATTAQKGIVQLSSATNSTSETLAATSKAVKAVMDETNKKAPLNSPALTGTPTTPTARQGTNNTQIASTAFVMAAIAALVDSSPDALNTLNELAAALGNDPNFATTMTNALAGKQPKDATLTALAGLATAADKFPYFTGNDVASLATLTKVGRDILAKSTVAAVIEYLGLRELGTSGEKIPLLSTANTWTNRQTFSGGLSGELSGNAATATKLKTARNINGVKFDGSSDININTLVSRNRVTALSGSAKGTPGIQMYEAYKNGYPFAYGNVLHLTGVAAVGEGELFIGWSGTSGGHAPAYIRSRRDTADANWSGWAQLYTTAHKPSAGDIGAYTKAECNSRFITGVRLGGLSSVQTWNGPGWSDKSGYVVTGSVNSNRDELIDTTQARPIQYCINGTWYNVGSI